MHRLVVSHASEFTEVGITMAQAKVLYVVMAAGRLRMSELAARLGIGSSSASELADRLVELGLLERHTDADDRRQVVVTATPDAEALLERFRELNVRQLRDLLSRLDAAELAIVERSMGILDAGHRPGRRGLDARPVRHIHTTIQPETPEIGDTTVSRLSRLALSKRSVTLLFAVALFFAGASAWGSLKQELLPDIDFPVITVVTPYPGAGSSDVTEQVTKPIENAISGVPRLETIQSTSSNSISLVVTQFSFGTDVKATTQAITEAIAKANLPASAQPTVQALNINASPVVISSIAATGSDGLQEVAQIARTEIVPEILGIEGVARADVTGGLEERVFITLDPAKMAAATITSQQIVGVLQANNLTLPSGPAARRRLEGPGLDDRRADLGRPDPWPRRRLPAGGARGARPGRLAHRPAAPRRRPVRASRPPPRRSRRSRSRSATSARSSPTSSRRPATAGPTATRRSP